MTSKSLNNRALFSVLITLLLLLLTTTAIQAKTDGANFAKKIAKAHGLKAWQATAAVESEIEVEFNGNKLLSGKMLFETTGGGVRMELEDGSVLVFDGKDAWTSPADSSFKGTRFHILTWPYFLAAPMKLQDPGTQLESLGKMPLAADREIPAARLTFDSGIGDTPDDWYVVYYDDKNEHLAGMAYIVTFGTEVSKAEEEPHAIVYEGMKKVDGVALSSEWTFWNWKEETGIFGDPIGKVVLRNLRFVTPAADAFTKPAGARAEPMPAP